MAAKATVQFFARLPASLHKRFVTVCKEEKRSMNGQIEVILEDWLKSRKSVGDAAPPASGK